MRYQYLHTSYPSRYCSEMERGGANWVLGTRQKKGKFKVYFDLLDHTYDPGLGYVIVCKVLQSFTTYW